MNDSEFAGLLLWLLIFYPVWSPRLRRRRKHRRINSLGEKVSGNGVAWEQDAPMSECFEDDL